jgi:hypothetical protein
MHKLTCALALLLLLAASGTAAAGNAAPLGVELGVATYDQVKTQIGKLTDLTDAGANKFSGGKVLASTGHGLDVDGLVRVLFIFDKSDVLQGVVMTLEHNFKATFDLLKRKYKLVSKQTPLPGYGQARFAQGASVITLEAPHMSFEMTLSYLSKPLVDAYRSRSADEKLQREKAQLDKL